MTVLEIERFWRCDRLAIMNWAKGYDEESLGYAVDVTNIVC